MPDPSKLKFKFYFTKFINKLQNKLQTIYASSENKQSTENLQVGLLKTKVENWLLDNKK